MDHFNQVISTQFILPDSPLNALRVVAVISQKITYLSLSPSSQPRPQGFSLKKWVGREKALASAGHVSPRTS